jgi:hypothetical protein
MPKKIAALVNELELIGADKITQPNGANRRAATRAAHIIKQLYEDNEQLNLSKSFVDSEGTKYERR